MRLPILSGFGTALCCPAEPETEFLQPGSDFDVDPARGCLNLVDDQTNVPRAPPSYAASTRSLTNNSAY
jgi:hypothetical protein